MKIYKKLENFAGIVPNFSYFFSSNIISYFFSFFFIIIFARNYSPVDFGKFTIAQTIFFLFYSISFSNIHYYLNKILSTKFQDRRKDIGSSFIITFYSSVVLYVFLAFLLTLLNIDDGLRNLILVLNLILITEPFSIFYSEIFVRGQFNRIFKIRFCQTLIFFSIKLYLVLKGFDLLFIAIAYVLENLFFSLIIIYYFKKNGNNFSNLIFEKKHTFNILKKIILFPLMAFAIIVAMRLDILMISNIIGDRESGIYSSASRLIIMVLFSFYMGTLFLIFSLFFSKTYLNLFGKEYLEALGSFKILSLTIFPALLFNLWIHKQYVLSNYSKILIFQISTIILNILLNYYFINIFGMKGAALASLTAPTISFIIINITNHQEFWLIAESFSFKKQKLAANAILKIIFVKKNPDKLENIND